ncbi:MAG TPA: carbohydrate ABC transporter permease [Spirochaetia bacterium]|nr:carbohydrate ABC transporter permease [Spirochaetia bacterium]
MRARLRPSSIAMALNYLLLFILFVVTAFPIYNILVVSLTGPKYIAAANGLSTFPRDITFVTYQALLSIPKVLRGLLNSIFITLAGVAVNMVMTSLAAYVLSRPRLPGRRFLMLFVIFTIVFEGGLIPDYMLMRNLHLLNNYLSVILYKGVNAYYLIIMIRFFEEVPSSLLDAARLDGLTETQILTRVVLPVSRAGVTTISLFYLVFHWNDYFRPLIYLTDPQKWPLQTVLREILVSSDKAAFIGVTAYLHYSGSSNIDIKALQSGMIILAIIPIILVYPILLRHFAKGALSGALKE